MTKHPAQARFKCALIGMKTVDKYALSAELFLELTKIVNFIYFERSSYSLCTRSIWFKTNYKKCVQTGKQTPSYSLNYN